MKTEVNAKLLKLIAADDPNLFIARAIALLKEETNIVEVMSDRVIVSVVSYDRDKLIEYLRNYESGNIFNFTNIEVNVHLQVMYITVKAIRYATNDCEKPEYYNTNSTKTDKYNTEVEISYKVSVYEFDKYEDAINFEVI